MIAFDADVLIYAAAEAHPLGRRIVPLLLEEEEVRIGSVLLLPEVLSKPVREDPRSPETMALVSVLSRLELRPVDEPTARLAVALGARHGLRAADATHLATAVAGGAGHFLTNNSRDFPHSITEIDVVHPADLPDPT